MQPALAPRLLPPDFGVLLNPISPAAPAGESLRYEGTYDEIHAARQEDDSELARGVWVAPLKRADWSRVESVCFRALEQRSKDLQLAAWLTEAWVHLYGFAGLRQGLSLLRGLCSAFWEEIHPRPEGDDLEYRLAPFVWINEKLTLPVKLTPLSKPDSENAKPCSWADWEAAYRAPNADPTQQGTAQAAFRQSINQTPTEFYTGLRPHVEGCVEACALLQSALEALCGPDTPTLGSLARAITGIRDLVGDVLTQRHVPGPEVADEPRQPGPDRIPAAEPEASRGASRGPIRSRAEAYQRLAEAADYLIRTEPHSPAPYLVRRAIKWGNMPLTELLPELIRSDSELADICRLLQIPDR